MKLRCSRIERSLVGGLAVSLGLLLAPAYGADNSFDGSRKLLCATTTLLECPESGNCTRSSHEQMDLPTFVEIDFGKKRLSGRVEGGAERVSSFQTVRAVDGRTIIQGGENGRGWSVAIDQATGRMSAAIAGDRVGFVLFGACTPK